MGPARFRPEMRPKRPNVSLGDFGGAFRGEIVLGPATGPNVSWSWDITYLKSPVRGMFFYLEGGDRPNVLRICRSVSKRNVPRVRIPSSPPFSTMLPGRWRDRGGFRPNRPELRTILPIPGTSLLAIRGCVWREVPPNPRTSLWAVWEVRFDGRPCPALGRPNLDSDSDRSFATAKSSHRPDRQGGATAK